MDTMRLLRLLPTMPMIVEAFHDAGWTCRAHIPSPEQSYRGIRLYHGQKDLQPDILYLLRPGETRFPTDTFSWLAAVEIEGDGNHFICLGKPDAIILDFVLELFSQYQQWEQMIDQLTYRSAGLQELCQLGSRLLDNPVCIHDDWFILIAMSQDAQAVMPPEQMTSSTRGFVPRMILNDFQHDSEYLETYAHRDAQIWHGGDGVPDSLYVNLWDGTVYQGRLLVIQTNRPFRQFDFVLAQLLAQRAMLLLNQQQPGDQRPLKSMDDVVYGLLEGKTPEPGDLTQLLHTLNWQKNHRFLCIRIGYQQSESKTVMEHLLHSDLFQLFPEGYILFGSQEQCILLDVTRDPVSIAMVRHRLAPLCRDYCLYAGISSPVSDIRDVHLCYYQAKAALDRAFRLRNEKWIIAFSECAMAHLLEERSSPLPPWTLVAPELLEMLAQDRQRGTEYFATFREYLLQERDIPRTSQALIIHRTTLLYRLKKIRSQWPLDLEDPWQRLYLLLSLWIIEQQTPKEW